MLLLPSLTRAINAPSLSIKKLAFCMFESCSSSTSLFYTDLAPGECNPSVP